MKKAIALTAIAGLASIASAQSILFAVDGAIVAPGTNFDTATDGDVFTIDVVLDATAYGGAFFAWHQYNFNINATGPLGAGDVGGNINETDFLETADTTGSGALGNAWTGGRRPGAFSGSASNNGGSRFGGDLGNVADGTGITGPAGTIGGRQQAPSSPENNALINQDRAYAAYRFQYTYNGGGDIVEFSLSDVVLNVYPQFGAFNEFVQPVEVGSVSFGIPAPASLALLGLGGLTAARRRR